MPSPAAPRAPRQPSERTVHGDRLVDDYAWMSDQQDPRLQAYLEAENAFAAEQTRSLGPLADAIVEEIRSRTVETDMAVPVYHGGWWYYSRTVTGQAYAVHARVPAEPTAPRPELIEDRPPEGEQLLLDENAEAAGGFLTLGACEVSPDGRLLGFSVDRTGDERYDLVVRDLATGQMLDDQVRQIGEGLAWSSDCALVYYTRLDDAWRPHQVWRHRLGTAADTDELVLSEPDEHFFLSVSATVDDRWIVLVAASKTTSQTFLIDAATPGPAIPVLARRPGVLADAEPCGDSILLLHNAYRSNFEVALLPRAGAPEAEWRSLPWSSPDELVTGVDVFDRFVAVSVRADGRPGVRLVARRPDGFADPRQVSIPGSLGTLLLGATADPGTRTLQVVHESLLSPPAVYDIDVDTGAPTLLKQLQVPGVDLSRLRESRLWARAADGTAVPISLVHRDDVRADARAAGVLYGYGAYGVATDPWFSVARLSLLDRGLIFAVAHVRGGTELGWDWYENGRGVAKENSFDDFVACARHLLDTGWVAADRLAAEGASAGGLLVAAAADRAPTLFAVIGLEVPFVDALTTMLDPELPLTVTEQDEWGDPIGDPAAYRRIKGWSPYERAAARTAADPYPAVVITASANDTRVLITEPAKWVARLRAGGARSVLLRTRMAGHAGVAGRYEAWADLAWQWAALLHHLGAADPASPSTSRPKAAGSGRLSQPALVAPGRAG